MAREWYTFPDQEQVTAADRLMVYDGETGATRNIPGLAFLAQFGRNVTVANRPPTSADGKDGDAWIELLATAP